MQKSGKEGAAAKPQQRRRVHHVDGKTAYMRIPVLFLLKNTLHLFINTLSPTTHSSPEQSISITQKMQGQRTPSQ